jgi:cytochrome c-type biogenesis protein CcmF
MGVAASSAGSQQQEVRLSPGEHYNWAGREVRLVALRLRTEPDTIVHAAHLDVAQAPRTVSLVPERHFHQLAQTWTTEVAIDSTTWSDFYVIYHGADANGRVLLTLIENPMVRWIWLGGWVIGAGTVLRLWPRRRRSVESRQAEEALPCGLPAARRAAA